MDVIKSSADITLLFTQGRRFKTPYLTFIVLEHRDCSCTSGGRVAFIAGKKLGNAVWRNKAKRRMREICRLLGGPWDGVDMAFVARKGLNEASFWDVCHCCQSLLKRKGYEVEYETNVPCN